MPGRKMKKILIVDDQSDVRKLLAIVLNRKNRHFLYAASGEEAIAIARAETPDLILLDVMMPGGMDGYEVARILKGDVDTRGCPIIAMTARGLEEGSREAFAAGADAYVSKPFNMTDLQVKVETLLA